MEIKHRFQNFNPKSFSRITPQGPQMPPQYTWASESKLQMPPPTTRYMPLAPLYNCQLKAFLSVFYFTFH